MTKSYDFIIVGAGPIGCTLALNLHHHGFKILILEKNVWGNVHGPYLNGMSEYFFPLFSKLKIREMVLRAKVNDGKRVTLTPPRGAKLEETWEENCRRIFFRRKEFDLSLRAQVQEEQIEFLDQIRAITPIWEQDKVIGIQCVSDQERYQFFSKFVLGSDGAHSKLAKTIGLKKKKTDHHHLYQGRLYSNTGFTDHLTSIFPFSKTGQLLLVFSVDHQEPGAAYVELETDLNDSSSNRISDKKKLEETFQQVFLQSNELSEAMRDAVPQEDWQIISSQGNRQPTLQLPGVALLGDAAYCADPIGASGLLLGLQGVEELLDIVKDTDESQWDFAQWEQHYLARIRDLQRFTKMSRFILKRPWLLQHVIHLLNRKPLHKKSFLEVFNGAQSYAEFLDWRYQLKFWLSAYKI